MTGSSAVIDASFAVNSVLPGPLQAICEDIFIELSDFDIAVPTLFLYETTSALTKAVRFGELTAEEGRRMLEQVADIPLHLVKTDRALNHSAFEWTLKLGRAAAYDCYYLALAESLGCDLWTADRKLARQVDLPWLRFPGELN
ncbi:MAG TPA: type II toxin-antitoxin system VapC family toxin [Anaerolineales bacterium]|nr:type II toxin-antitoxin system VapC family toxin [Anaerolineales bacterium]